MTVSLSLCETLWLCRERWKMKRSHFWKERLRVGVLRNSYFFRVLFRATLRKWTHCFLLVYIFLLVSGNWFVAMLFLPWGWLNQARGQHHWWSEELGAKPPPSPKIQKELSCSKHTHYFLIYKKGFWNVFLGLIFSSDSLWIIIESKDCIMKVNQIIVFDQRVALHIICFLW